MPATYVMLTATNQCGHAERRRSDLRPKISKTGPKAERIEFDIVNRCLRPYRQQGKSSTKMKEVPTLCYVGTRQRSLIRFWNLNLQLL